MLTFHQTNILIDARGRVYVAGFGVAFLQSPMPGVDIDRFFHGTAPELVNCQSIESISTGITKDSDVYAFSVLAWEVSPTLECFTGNTLNGVGFF